jgi:hypothetical protein
LSGTGDLTKEGSGRLEFNTINTLAGDVIHEEGSLVNNVISETIFPNIGILSLAVNAIVEIGDPTTSNFQLNNNQSIIGEGFCFCNLITNSGAIVSPGFSPPGSMITDQLNMNTGSILSIEINGNTAVTDYDVLILASGGSLDADSLGGATLDLSFGYTPIDGDEFEIISSETGITGTFNGLPEGGQFVVQDQLLSITYVGGDGNDVVITALGSSIRYVDADAAASGDGKSWGTAFAHLQDALAIAVSGMEIWVADGVYYPDLGSVQVDNDVTSTFNLINGVKLYGGFNGTETDLSMRDTVTNVTVLSGDLEGDDTLDSDGVTAHFDDLVGNNAYHVLTTLLTDDSTIIDGITISAGWASGVNSDEKGSAIYCQNSNVTINDVTVQGNRSNDRAALWDCDSLISQSSFINNFASDVGAITTTPTTFTDTLFMGNKAGSQGSAFYLSGGTLNLTRVKFIANHSRSVVRVQNTDLNFNDVLFSGNVTKGSIDLSGTAHGTLNNITMIGNRSTNSAGGGINSATNGDLIINNSIFWNNQNTTGLGTLEANISHSGAGVITISSSVVQDSATNPLWDTAILKDGGGNLDQDPLFVADTDPSTAPTTLGNAHLNVSSPAINAGDNNVLTSDTDLDGNIRIQDTIVDMGAYEFSSYSVSVTVSGLNGDQVVLQNNGTDELIFDSNGTQAFTAQVANYADYLITVFAQPTNPNQSCTISNSSGTVDGDNITNVLVDCVNQYNVAVYVSGLANGVTLSLLNNAESIDVTSIGRTNFPTALNEGSAYAVSINTQPSSPNQMCLITSKNASGILSGEDAVVTIACTTLKYNISVDVSGLANGNSIEFENDGESLFVFSNSVFVFDTAIDDGSDYDVSLTAQPTTPNQVCSILSGTGTLQGQDVVIPVICTTNQYFVGGIASGLDSGNSVTLTLDAEDLSVNNNGPFVFLNPLTDEAVYNVSVSSQPTVPNQTCELVNSTVTITGEDVTDLEVNCTTNQYMIGGFVNGLHSGNNLVLQNNGDDDLTISSDGDFDFVSSIEDLQSYDVTILNQPSNPIQTCVPSNNTGNVSGEPVITVEITCEFGDDLIYRGGFD